MWLYSATSEEISILKNYLRRKEKKSEKEKRSNWKASAYLDSSNADLLELQGGVQYSRCLSICRCAPSNVSPITNRPL